MSVVSQGMLEFRCAFAVVGVDISVALYTPVVVVITVHVFDLTRLFGTSLRLPRNN